MTKDCVGYPGYSVDEEGNVFSHRRRVGKGKGNGLGTNSIIDKNYCHRLPHHPGHAGYPVVYLSRKSTHCSGAGVLVHRLVAEAFIPNPENKPCVNHIDFDITNPRVENLEWVTYSENNKHSIRHGRMAGEKSNFAKLTQMEVLAIKVLANTTVRRKDIAMLFGITPDYVRHVQSGKDAWKYLDTEALLRAIMHQEGIKEE